MNPSLGTEWIDRHAEPLWRAFPEPVVLDCDSTEQLRYWHQEGAEIGYNRGKPDRRSLHLRIAVEAHSRLYPAYWFKAGDTVTATDWRESMEDAQRWFGERKVWLNRGDLGLSHDAVMSWHEEAPERPKYLFKLKLNRWVRPAFGQVREESWQGCATLQTCQVAEGLIQVTGWKTDHRVIFAQKLLGVIRGPENAEFWERHQHKFTVHVTNLPTTCYAWQI